MTNAKDELLQILDGNAEKIKCAKITYLPNFDKDEVEITLPLPYSMHQLRTFLEALDFEYDSGYGSQHIGGVIWLNETNEWLERREYDGSEWWEHMYCPDIPDELFALTK